MRCAGRSLSAMAACSLARPRLAAARRANVASREGDVKAVTGTIEPGDGDAAAGSSFLGRVAGPAGQSILGRVGFLPPP